MRSELSAGDLVRPCRIGRRDMAKSDRPSQVGQFFLSCKPLGEQRPALGNMHAAVAAAGRPLSGLNFTYA